MISVLILTFNEELTLPSCLDCLDWCDDIVIYDSYSTDRTESIALSAGARFVQRPCQDTSISFGGDEGYHRTWALRNISFVHPWLLVLDADERLPPSTFDEIRSCISELQLPQSSSTQTSPVAYQLRRRDFFQGRHLKHVQATPFYIRLFLPEFVSYERLINPVTVVTGPIACLSGTIDHFPFSKGLSHWIDRHNIYSTLEARELCIVSAPLTVSTFFTAILNPHYHKRRACQKLLFMSLPARPLIKFLWLYLLKCGFLDSQPGFTYALLQSVYEFFIVLKVREIRRLPSPASY